MSESKCRTGCKTKDHASWGECARAARMQVGPGESAPAMYWGGKPHDSKSWDGELNAYQNVRAQGVQPEGTTKDKVDAAVAVSERIGKPYDANTMPPTSALLANPQAASKSVEYGLV